MPRNPFDNPLFVPVFLRVVLLIVIGLAGVLLAQRRSFTVLRRSTFFTRTRTWFWIGPLFLICVYTGGFVAFVLATFVVIQGLSEFVRMAGVDRRYALLLMLWSEVGLLVAALARDYFLLLPFLFFVLLTLLPVITGEITDARRQLGDTLFGYIWIGLPMAYIAFVKAAQPWGLDFLVIVAVSVATSDIAAYAVGAALKGPKMIPSINPTKTWSGALGNLLGATVGVALLAIAIPDEWTVAGVVALVLTIAVGCAWGDVTESFVKRTFRAESSSMMFGFGGILDRVDSLLIALPLSYYALILANQVFG
ncbi:MAG TPA: CDP-archaeol synthase [Actinomycetes bacterium]|jgi:phosphatidate cytidylyltransferase|nr:CDP-archaeol synthase [Actinomycetes bacterium]